MPYCGEHAHPPPPEQDEGGIPSGRRYRNGWGRGGQTGASALDRNDPHARGMGAVRRCTGSGPRLCDRSSRTGCVDRLPAGRSRLPPDHPGGALPARTRQGRRGQGGQGQGPPPPAAPGLRARPGLGGRDHLPRQPVVEIRAVGHHRTGPCGRRAPALLPRGPGRVAAARGIPAPGGRVVGRDRGTAEVPDPDAAGSRRGDSPDRRCHPSLPAHQGGPDEPGHLAEPDNRMEGGQGHRVGHHQGRDPDHPQGLRGHGPRRPVGDGQQGVDRVRGQPDR